MLASENVEQLLIRVEQLTHDIVKWVEGERAISLDRAKVLYQQREEVLQQLKAAIFHSGVPWTAEQIKVWKQRVDTIQDIDRKIVKQLGQRINLLKQQLLQRQKQKQVLRYQEKNRQQG